MSAGAASDVLLDAERYTFLDRLTGWWERTWGRIPLMTTTAMFVLSFGPLLLLWELLYRAQIWPKALFPSPVDVVLAGIQLTANGTLLTDIAVSMKNLLIGFVFGAGLAVPLGLLMGMNRIVSRLVDPVVNLLQAIPGLAWIPLAILWFGLNQGAVTFIIFMSAFFPILFNTLLGVRTTDRVLVDASLTLGARRVHILVHVILPSTLPFVITGMRLGFGYGFRALVAGEMIAATAGIGYMIFDARNYLRSDIVVLGMLVIGILWLAIDRLVLKPIEHATVERWGTLHEF